MKLYLQNMKTIFERLFEKGDGINLNSIRRARLIYALAYTAELIFFSFQKHYFDIELNMFGVSGNTIAIIAHGLASLCIMLLWSDRFRHLIRISVAVTIIGFVSFYFFYENLSIQFIFGVLAFAGLGGVVTACRCGFAFVANNAERLFGMLLMFASTSVIRCFDLPETAPRWIPSSIGLILIGVFSVCLLLFREEDFEVKDTSDRNDTKGLYWALAFFIAYFSVDGYLWKILNYAGRTEELILFLGLLTAGVVLFAVLIFLKWNIWMLWNFFFVFLCITAVLFGFFPTASIIRPLNFFAGLSVMGWPLCIYMLACAQRYFASYRLLKKCTVIFVVLSPIANFSDDLVFRHFPNSFPLVSSIVLIGIVFALLLMSPYSYKHLFSAMWVREIRGEDMIMSSAAREASDPFEGYDLTPRQKEVALLLLEAKTRRQIAGELKVSESTVKTHTSELYRKLGINSRVELFRMFGVKPQDNGIE